MSKDSISFDIDYKKGSINH